MPQYRDKIEFQTTSLDFIIFSVSFLFRKIRFLGRIWKRCSRSTPMRSETWEIKLFDRNELKSCITLALKILHLWQSTRQVRKLTSLRLPFQFLFPSLEGAVAEVCSIFLSQRDRSSKAQYELLPPFPLVLSPKFN